MLQARGQNFWGAVGLNSKKVDHLESGKATYDARHRHAVLPGESGGLAPPEMFCLMVDHFSNFWPKVGGLENPLHLTSLAMVLCCLI